jgi:hypothetical protein
LCYYGVIQQKTELSITTTVRTSNPTCVVMSEDRLTAAKYGLWAAQHVTLSHHKRNEEMLARLYIHK